MRGGENMSPTSESLGAWGTFLVGLLVSIGIPYIYLVENNSAAFNWYLHVLFAGAFVWGAYSVLKGAAWLLGRWTGRDNDMAELKAQEFGCWALVAVFAAGFALLNWDNVSKRFDSISSEMDLILLAVVWLGYAQWSVAKQTDRTLGEIRQRLDRLEERDS